MIYIANIASIKNLATLIKLKLKKRLWQKGLATLILKLPWVCPEAPGAMGEVLYAIAGWVAKMESERRSERTKAGLARAISQGTKLGRPTGSKDAGKRKRTGYLLRYANKR